MARHFFIFVILLSTTASAALPKLIPYRKGDLWGYADSTKKIIITPQFEEVSFFSGKTAVVKMDGRDGLIDTTGRIIVACTFYSIYAPARHGYRLFCSSGDTENNCLMNEKGETVLGPIDGYFMWVGDYIFRYDRSGKDYKVSLLTYDGTPITAPDFRECRECYSPTYESSAKGAFVMRKKSGLGAVDSTGKEIIPFLYDSITYNGRFRCVKGKNIACFNFAGMPADCGEAIGKKKYPTVYHAPKSGSYYSNTWRDTTGKLVRLPGVKEARPFIRGYAVFMDTTLKSGIVDENFRIVIPAKYSTVMGFDRNGLTFVRIRPDKIEGNRWVKGKTGYVDIYGTEYWED